MNEQRVKGAKSIGHIPWNKLVYYDETSPTCIRHNRDIVFGNNKTLFKARKGDKAGSKTQGGYHSIFLSKYGTFPVHRIVWFLNTGEDVPVDKIIDHIDGDRLNNKFSNLRLVNESENTRNTKMYKNNTVGVTGVYFDTKNDAKGKPRYYWKTSWQELDGKQKTKSFSISKYGLLPAFKLAFEYRQLQIKRLNEHGAGYTDRHGIK